MVYLDAPAWVWKPGLVQWHDWPPLLPATHHHTRLTLALASAPSSGQQPLQPLMLCPLNSPPPAHGLTHTQVDLYENGTIAIVEAVSPELGNRVQRVRVQLPGTSSGAN